MVLIDYNTKYPRFDSRINTYEEYFNVIQFVKYGLISSSKKKSRIELMRELRDIGYDESKHKSYTFQYDSIPGALGTDVRYVKIKELDKYISLL